MVLHSGSCHCGRVTFDVEAPRDLVVHECNCSICHRVGFLHLIVDAQQFTLRTGEADLVTYTFGTQTARHLFCGTCGVKGFYVPRSHPDGYSVNARCLDDASLDSLEIRPFDGRNWEENVRTLDD